MIPKKHFFFDICKCNVQTILYRMWGIICYWSVCLLQQKDAQNADFQVMCNSSANAHIKKTLEISVTFQWKSFWDFCHNRQVKEGGTLLISSLAVWDVFLAKLVKWCMDWTVWTSSNKTSKERHWWNNIMHQAIIWISHVLCLYNLKFLIRGMCRTHLLLSFLVGPTIGSFHLY